MTYPLEILSSELFGVTRSMMSVSQYLGIIWHARYCVAGIVAQSN